MTNSMIDQETSEDYRNTNGLGIGRYVDKLYN